MFLFVVKVKVFLFIMNMKVLFFHREIESVFIHRDSESIPRWKKIQSPWPRAEEVEANKFVYNSLI